VTQTVSIKYNEKWVDMFKSGKLMGVELRCSGTRAHALKRLQKEMSDWTDAVLHFFDVRFLQDQHEIITVVSKCMDLRLYCRENFGRLSLSQYLQQKVRPHFNKVWSWAADAGVGIAERSVVWSELCLLAERLYTDIYTFYRGAEMGQYHRWHDKQKKVNVSGTVIQEVVFRDKRWYDGCSNVLHLYQMCALKSMNEAVVEGMCKVVDEHAQGNRGLSLHRYAYESIIHYNMPSQKGVACFINSCLQRYATKYTNCSILRFHSTDKKQRALKSFVSQTVDRHMKNLSRLSFI
jgi:hypothetical protein